MLLFAFDLETTGLEKDAQITQIAFASEKNEQYMSLVKCDKIICEASVAVTGITNEMLKNAPFLNEIIDSITDFFNKHNHIEADRLLCGHNGKDFDLPILVNELKRIGKDPIHIFREWKLSYFVDSLAIAKELLDTTKLKTNERKMPCYKLTSIYECSFGHCFDHAHNALHDTLGLLQLMTKIDVFKDAVTSDFLKNDLTKCKFLKNILKLISEVPDLVVSNKIKKDMSKDKLMMWIVKKQKLDLPSLHDFTIFEPWFTFVKNKIKTKEGRRGNKDTFAHLLNREITFNKTYKCQVTNIKHYQNLSEMLQSENLDLLLPNVKTIEDGLKIYHEFWSDEDVQLKGGMCVLDIKTLTQ